jgi:MFS family permease
VESYGLFLGALILVGGSLGDLFGRRLIFMAGVSIFTVASVACGIAPSIPVLIVARSTQGVGAALLVPGSLAIISTSFDEKSRGQAIGTWSGFTAITMAVGPVLGGWLVEHASWRWVFFINLPLAAAVIAISVWRIPETNSAVARRVDWLGALLATLGLGGVVFGFIESTDLGWRNPLVFGSLIVGFGCLIGFAALEVHTTFPMIPLALFKNPSFGGANLLTLFLYAAIGIFFLLVPAKPDPGSEILLNFSRCSYPAVHSSDVSSFALVWRTCHALWRKKPIDRRASGCRSWLRPVCRAHYRA